MKIQILPPDVVSQIAAGEVLERPANLVKELTENSLDAGATEIEIDLQSGGRFVRIKDNGRGITPEELPLALARHATSKLSTSADLWSLGTFGFRGEALASISAVSHTQIVTRPPHLPKASRIQAQFGETSEVSSVGGEPGTTITVDELFKNVPARLKFLKSETAEISQIRRALKALALAHPECGFKVRVDQKLIHHFARAESVLERVGQVLPDYRFFESDAELSGFAAHVVFASPKQTSGNSQNIWLFAQGRWIQDRSLQAAVMEAYRNLLMHHEYPVAAVFLTCAPEEIDVNIHPTKAQVKFRDPSSAFRVVQHALRKGLENAPWIQALNQNSQATFYSETANHATDNLTTNFTTEIQMPFEATGGLEQTQYRSKSFELRSPGPTTHLETATASTASTNEDSSASLRPSIHRFWTDLEVLAQAHLTYIVAQSRSAIFFVDQHAAHERVMFEKLLKNWRDGKVEIQDFLIPLSLEFTTEECEALLTQVESLKSFGLSIEPMSETTLVIRSAPTLIKERALPQTLKLLATEILDSSGSFAFERKVSDICATLACHSVVRAGQALSLEECRSLLSQMDEFPLSSFCPHGRPVYVEYPISKLDRDFGRIV